MAQLTHPSIVTVYDVGTVGEQVFISMELVEGASLRRWLEEPRSWREVLAVFLQAGRGLAAAHAARLIHRDFKPDNVLIGSDGRARVADFGLARGLAAPAEPAAPVAGVDRAVGLSTPLTRAGDLLGTPAYMAPEQLAGGDTDERTDQFGFCVAFYEALYGEMPFAASTLSEQRSAIAAGQVRPAPLKSAVPEWLRARVLRGLAARPQDRFPSLAALLDALPADPDSDATLSSRGRAAITAIFAAVCFGVMLWQRFSSPDGTVFGTRAFIAFGVGMAPVVAFSLMVWRKTLLQTRIARQIIASTLTIYYVSLLASYLGYRAHSSVEDVVVINQLWSACCFFLLGLTLARLFLWMGAATLFATGVALGLPAHAATISQLTLIVLLLIPAFARAKIFIRTGHL
jgi:hypothetical protein